MAIKGAVCSRAAESCICNLPFLHRGPHHCECGALWEGQYGTMTFKVIEYPSIAWKEQQGEANGV